MFLLLRKCIKEVNINQITYKYFKLYIDLGGGIGIVEMLKKTNILALVGGGRLPKYSKNKITIWDDHQGKIISQIRFNKDVLSVKMRTDSIIGILEDKIYIIHIQTLEIIDILDTLKNQNGIFAMSNDDFDLSVAFPQAKNKGKVKFISYNIEKNNFNKNITKIFNAHETNIAYITMNNKGTLLVTASDKGTYIRLFNIMNKEMIIELKRGSKNVKINCLALDFNNEFLACTSDAGTIHIFDIHEVNKILESYEDKDQNKINNENKIKEKEKPKIKIKERSFTKYKIQEERSIVGFYQSNSFVALTSNGIVYKASFDVKNGIYKNEKNFIKIGHEK